MGIGKTSFTRTAENLELTCPPGQDSPASGSGLRALLDVQRNRQKAVSTTSLWCQSPYTSFSPTALSRSSPEQPGPPRSPCHEDTAAERPGHTACPRLRHRAIGIIGSNYLAPAKQRGTGRGPFPAPGGGRTPKFRSPKRANATGPAAAGDARCRRGDKCGTPVPREDRGFRGRETLGGCGQGSRGSEAPARSGDPAGTGGRGGSALWRSSVCCPYSPGAVRGPLFAPHSQSPPKPPRGAAGASRGCPPSARCCSALPRSRERGQTRHGTGRLVLISCNFFIFFSLFSGNQGAHFAAQTPPCGASAVGGSQLQHPPHPLALLLCRGLSGGQGGPGGIPLTLREGDEGQGEGEQGEGAELHAGRYAARPGGGRALSESPPPLPL